MPAELVFFVMIVLKPLFMPCLLMFFLVPKTYGVRLLREGVGKLRVRRNIGVYLYAFQRGRSGLGDVDTDKIADAVCAAVEHHDAVLLRSAY